MKLLADIKNGDDLKQLSRQQLPLLAEEIRQRIISVVSKNGGHLASSLGAVELTIAIHYVFSLPEDTLIWDVGHQAYAHKLLTGREKDFDTLRTFKGLTGFTKMSENPCDGFTVGHSSTSISAGLGICTAKFLKNESSKVISVIGDGSLTAGLAYEGLNQAGDSAKDLIVILNDNDMSISPNVGALSSFLSRKLSAKYLQNLKKEVGSFLKSLPGIGDDVYRIAKRSEDSFKTFITPGMLFEAFNFDYFGPIDGHRLNHLIDILINIKKHDEPVLLHVTTKKGKGYTPAEKNPVYFHGVGCFDVPSGNCVKKKNTPPSYTDIFGRTMVKLAKGDRDIVAVTAAMPEGTGLVEFSKLFPDRFFDVGIAEQHAVTFAAGLACRGIKPVVAIYSTFMQRAYDQILHDVCLESLGVVFAMDRGGVVGEDGPTHHGLFDFAFLRSIPNMTVMAPKDENELARMLKTALDYPGPIALRYPRGKGIGVDIDDVPLSLPIGKGELLCSGDDLVIIAIGRCVQEALDAAAQLKEKNISTGVINARFVKPLDRELILEHAEKTGAVITAEEHVLDGGFGSAVLELLADTQHFKYRVKRVGIKDCFVEHGPQKILRKTYEVDASAIVKAAEELGGFEEKG
ncbi:MAG: 1-deoxy-D-xylulose-5-phosphate synthase [Desulfobacteraceae bacterium]